MEVKERWMRGDSDKQRSEEEFARNGEEEIEMVSRHMIG